MIAFLVIMLIAAICMFLATAGFMLIVAVTILVALMLLPGFICGLSAELRRERKAEHSKPKV